MMSNCDRWDFTKPAERLPMSLPQKKTRSIQALQSNQCISFHVVQNESPTCDSWPSYLSNYVTHTHTRVNKQELNTPNAIACSLPVLDLPPTTLEHAPRLLSLDSGSFRKQLSHVQSNTRKIESNGEVVKHALQAQELSNRTQATLLKAQLNAMFIFWKKKNAHCELRIRVASKMCPTFEAHHSCKRCIDRTQLPCLQTVIQIAPFPEGAYH